MAQKRKKRSGLTLYLRGLPDALVRAVKAEAARRGITLTALVAEFLRTGVGSDVQNGASQDLSGDIRWYQANRRRLLRRYRDEYVAIHEGKVVDHDRNFDALASRVFARFGPRPVFMPKVTEEDRVVRLPSPFMTKS
jgi:hypothetical protein